LAISACGKLTEKGGWRRALVAGGCRYIEQVELYGSQQVYQLSSVARRPVVVAAVQELSGRVLGFRV
jgi:hypothetical protein